MSRRSWAPCRRGAFEAADVYQHLGTLARREDELVPSDWFRKQPAITGDLECRWVPAEAQAKHRGVAPVEHPQPYHLIVYRNIRRNSTVREKGVPEIPVHEVRGQRAIGKCPRSIEPAFLQDERDVVFAVLVRKWGHAVGWRTGGMGRASRTSISCASDARAANAVIRMATDTQYLLFTVCLSLGP